MTTKDGIYPRLVLALIFVGLALLVGHKLELYLPDLEARIQAMGAFAPLGFILLFVVLTPLFISVDALCFAAGVLFPVGPAVCYVIVATYLAAAVIFFLGRYLLHGKVQALLAKYKRFAEIDRVIKAQGLKLMFLLRLMPLPFAMLSYAFSATEVRFGPYLAATSGILIYNAGLVYFGYTTKHLSGLVSGTPAHGGVSYPLLALGAVVALAVLIVVAKVAGKTVKQLGYKD